jgi:trk system potassium uptake protein TrkH
MSFASIFRLLGWAVAAFGASMLLPAALAVLSGAADLVWTFAASAGLTCFVGAGLIAATKGRAGDLDRREVYVFAVLTWFVLAAFGAVPLYFADHPATPVDALFEAVSGLTTTGATVISDLDGASAAVLFWRALLQGLGGFLTLLMIVVLLSPLSVGGLDLADSALPRGQGAALPERLAQTAREISWVYLALVAACALLLWLTGMSALEALCHALSAVSTGGFSTRDGGIGAFDNIGIEAVMAGFMLLGACNFTLLWALANGRRGGLRVDAESRYLVYLVVLAMLVLGGLAVVASGAGPMEAARFGVFTAISLLTTSGYQSGAELGAQVVAPALMMALVLVGGATISSAGGLKLLRLAVLVKQARRELAQLVYPHAVIPVRLGARTVRDHHIWAVWSYVFVLASSLAGVAVALSAFGLEAPAALATAVAALANAGPAAGLIDPAAPAYGELGGGAKLLLALVMILGRVELLTFAVLLNPSYWRG